MKVYSDLVRALDDGHQAVLALLDMTAEFDTVDHSISPCAICTQPCNEKCIVLDGFVLTWVYAENLARLQEWQPWGTPLIC